MPPSSELGEFGFNRLQCRDLWPTSTRTRAPGSDLGSYLRLIFADQPDCIVRAVFLFSFRGFFDQVSGEGWKADQAQKNKNRNRDNDHTYKVHKRLSASAQGALPSSTPKRQAVDSVASERCTAGTSSQFPASFVGSLACLEAN